MSLPGTSSDSDPVRLSTSEVLDWMTNFADSKEGIKVKLMNIVQENDLDGHALKQLRDDPEELHDLLPVLKERLTFKAMMKNLFGLPTSSQRQNNSAGHRAVPNSGVSTDRQSPLQLPTTSLESPPPPPLVPQVPPVTQIGQYPSIVSAGQSIFVNPQTEPPLKTVATKSGGLFVISDPQQGEIYQSVYPTGILSDPSSSHFLPTSSSVYNSHMQDSSEVSPCSPAAAGRVKDGRKSSKLGSQAVFMKDEDTSYDPKARSPTYRKVEEFNRKYKKILQKVRSAPADGDDQELMQIGYPAPLPNFSPILRQQIEKGNLLSFKTRFVYECAQFYMGIDPTPTHTSYRNISMTIVNTYPELADRTKHKAAWKAFNTSLSQAVRNIRRRLRSVPGTGFPPAAQRYQAKHLRDRRSDPESMNIQHNEEMTEDDGSLLAGANESSEGPTNEMSGSPEGSDSLECLDMPEDFKITIEDDSDSEMKEIVIKAEKDSDSVDEEAAAAPIDE